MVTILSDNDNASVIAELRAEILSKRNCGEIVIELKKLVLANTIKNSKELITIIDLFIGQLGYSSLGSAWKQINHQEAQNIIVSVMKKDLAYSTKLMALQEAEDISTKFLNLFSGNCSFFTNASFTKNYAGLSTWNSITKSTFDTGIVIVSLNHIGILWVQDED